MVGRLQPLTIRTTLRYTHPATVPGGAVGVARRWGMAAGVVLPSGTVTFVFTDIESSSARWEADPAGMVGVLARHDELVREAISGGGGHVFKHLGDGMCAAFASAPEALDAAKAAITALEAEPWPDGRLLRVRVGLHSGSGAVLPLTSRDRIRGLSDRI